MIVKELISRDPVTIDPDSDLITASKLMKKEGVGSLLVTEGDEPKGIISERDIISAIASDLPLKTKVRDVMSTNLVTADAGTEIGEAAILMVSRGIRHLVVMEKGKVIGVISLRDVARSLGLITTDLSIW
ncbi:CBS domain-containing protein [Metallosphaera hakonensis]|uniref:CBS domain-containing protein n=1 Tax=Metallosphaera hakonensis JCM 8857 = DSM 7519 TaxID=1293036 RepID=A0A2U9IVY4_9CREN|nr:CBS domain-containing protein [Metallosphaera hakonensis]AWS00241.1 CBS domain-containing protein [Metallosphaera hakonensis JCM 8857 = DSM 7519]